MNIIKKIPLLEEIFSDYKEVLGADFEAYQNHVYRVLNFCQQLNPNMDEETWQKLIIAGCFHDLGIWTAGSFDYLRPSVALVEAYLTNNKLEKWAIEITLMINLHHRFRKYTDVDNPLVELFRRADWLDVSLGVWDFGVPRAAVREIQKAFPNAGFHLRLLQLMGRQILKNPLRPLPMMRW